MNVHFGGPDQPPRALRDLLEARADAVPARGAIDWTTYYFRDLALADALVRAHRRGVKVRVRIEGKPRLRSANDAVIEMLRSKIGEGLSVERRLFGAAHLHTKLYAFSAPEPHALVGSFNPSGNVPENPAVVAEIGDQDRGHNLLVEVTDPVMVRALIDQVDAGSGGTQAFFFPRLGGNPLDNRIAGLGEHARLRMAASHVRDGRTAQLLVRLVERGGTVELLTHHTLRRSPEPLVQFLRSGGVATYRYEHPEQLPMHAKFMLAEDGARRWSAFGSYNLTKTSRWLNRELLMFSEDAEMWAALDSRWSEILAGPWVTK